MTDLEALDESWSSALAIVAHPDDLEYGAAAARHVLAYYETVADVLPAIQRLIWLGNDNHTIVSAGILLEQLEKARGIPFLPLPGLTRIPQFLENLRAGKKPEGKAVGSDDEWAEATDALSAVAEQTGAWLDLFMTQAPAAERGPDPSRPLSLPPGAAPAWKRSSKAASSASPGAAGNR